MKNRSNMLTGNPFTSLLLFALPMVFGNLFQQLYSIVDSIIVGKFVGQIALAAIGSTSTIIFIYVGIALGLSTGCMIVFAQLLGAGHIARMRKAMYTAIIALSVLGVIALAIGLSSTDLILNVTNISRTEYFADARTYYVIYAIGFPAMFVYNIASSVFTSLGKSKYTLFLLGGSAVLNVVLDLWFVIGLRMGVAGAAIATDISQYVVAAAALIWALAHLRKHYPLEEKVGIFEFRLLGNMLKIAIPSMLAQVVVSIGYAVLMALVNTFGTDIASGYCAAYKIDAICSIPMIQFGNAMATFTSQNVGAKQYDRIAKGIKAAGIMCCVVWVFFIGIVFLAGHQLIGLFMEEGVSEAAYTAGIGYMKVMSLMYILLGLMYVFSATLRGAGDYIMSLIAVTCNFTGRCIFAYVMVMIWDNSHLIEAGLNHVSANTAAFGSEIWIWVSNPIGWIIALVISIPRYCSGVWKTKRIADKV